MSGLLNKQLVTANDILTSFKYKPEDCKIVNKTLITKVEMRTVQRMMTENCMRLTCYDRNLEPVRRAATIIPENKYREAKAKIINKEKLKECDKYCKGTISNTIEKQKNRIRNSTFQMRNAIAL